MGVIFGCILMFVSGFIGVLGGCIVIELVGVIYRNIRYHFNKHVRMTDNEIYRELYRIDNRLLTLLHAYSNRKKKSEYAARLLSAELMISEIRHDVFHEKEEV